MKKLVIIDAGGFAREVAWLVEEINNKNKQLDLAVLLMRIQKTTASC